MISNFNKPWWKDAIIYEVYVDKFSGTFVGLTEKLEYLKFLGVQASYSHIVLLELQSQLGRPAQYNPREVMCRAIL